MPPMKIQPIDVDSHPPFPVDLSKPPVHKSRLKRLFDRGVLRISSVEQPPRENGAGGAEFEPSSVCLAKMVQSYMEETLDKPLRNGRHRCSCFNGGGHESSVDEFDPSSSDPPLADTSDILKGLVPCASVAERKLLADASMIVEKNKSLKHHKDELMKIVAVGLKSIGYDSSICKSRWERSPSFPAGEYEYIDALVEGERILMDVDFRSEFEIARSTGAYKAVLHSLPFIFVGKPDRLGQIVSVVSEAARVSLNKKGMHFPPWRKAEYVLAKWMSPFTRLSDGDDAVLAEAESEKAELELGTEPVTWQLPASKPKETGGGGTSCKMVTTGLASLLKEKA